MNADSNQGFAASPRQLGLGEKRIRLLAAAAATDRLVIEERTTTQTRNNKWRSVLSCVMAVTRLAWCPREHTGAPHIEDDRVKKEGALQPRLVPLRVHEGGVHVPEQNVDVLEQDAVDALHCGSTQKNGCLDQNMATSAVFIIVLHTSSVLVTVRATKKFQNYFRPGNHYGFVSGIRGSFAKSRFFFY